MTFDLSGQVALVTGASGALGGVLTRRLVAAGARVAATGRDGERLLATLLDAGLEPSERLTAHAVDLVDAATVEALIAEVVRRHGRLDHLFNVAGTFAAADSVEATPDELWARLWDANFRATLHACRAAAPVMKRQGAGTIVNVGARAALAGGAGVAAYSVSKTAVMRLTESLAAEGKRHGVRVNCVLPGTLDTPANHAAMPTAKPAGWIELDALVDVLLFLASPAARALHGAAIPVFGAG